MILECNECRKKHKYLIQVVFGVQFAEDPPNAWRYSTYADGRIEERFLCPPCLKDQLFPPIMDTSKGVPVDES